MEFKDLKEGFLQAELPFHFTPMTHHEIGTDLFPIPDDALELLLPIGETPDEFTEYMPCFWFNINVKVIAFVYWKAGLQGNEYRLATFFVNGTRIENYSLAGNFYTDKGMTYNVASIGRDFTIFTKKGMTKMDESTLLEKNSGIIQEFYLNDEGLMVKIIQ